MKVLVTGGAGFIGAALCQRLLDRGDEVLAVDNLNDYYEVNLKLARLENLQKSGHFEFIKLDIADRDAMAGLFQGQGFDVVVNLAAQAGVRYSIDNPARYIDSNLVGFGNILEGCRHQHCGHLVYASSSSVYGGNLKQPFSENDPVDHPVSLYAATKKANELMAHTYASLYGLPVTGLRFFTVYGPFGRPDMALFIFTKKILAGEPIDVFNFGNHRRDFTYVGDIVEGIIGALDHVAQPNADWNGDMPDPGTSQAPYRLYNIGNQRPVDLLRYIDLLEGCLGRTAERNLLPLQLGDVPDTWADVEDLVTDVGYRPETPVEEGIKRFVEWYLEYYQVTL